MKNPFSAPMNRRRLKRALWGWTLLSGLALAWGFAPGTASLSRDSKDWMYRYLNSDRASSDRVVMIDIDEQSMKLLGPHYGRWPWPRTLYKELIEFLSLGEPSAILFDLLFTEASALPEQDALLAEISAQNPSVSHAALLLPEVATGHDGRVSLPASVSDKFALTDVNGTGALAPGLSKEVPETLGRYKDFNLPTERLLQGTQALHVVSVDPDSDGKIRRIPLVYHYDGHWLPTLALQGVLKTLKNPRLQIHSEGSRLSHLLIDSEGSSQLRIPLDSSGYLPLHFYRKGLGAEGEGKVLSLSVVMGPAAQLQKGEVTDPAQLAVNPLDFKGKVILIGGSAAGLDDLKVDPVHGTYAGTLLYATAISNILQSYYLNNTDWRIQAFLGLLLLACVYGFVFGTQNFTLRLVGPAASLLAFAGASMWLFRYGSQWLEISGPLVTGLIAFMDSIAYLMISEGREKKKMKDTLSKYLSPSVTESLLASGQDPRAEVGKRQELSILFSDIRGFTTLSEKMKAEELVGVLNQYLDRMTEIVFRKHGTLDKFIGDAVMAFWGAPIADGNHALNAVECALEMRTALEDLNRQWTQPDQPLAKLGVRLAIGIGINTGEVIVGNIGSERRLDYTVIGDHVNLASRLEGLTKQYHLTLIIGERTEELIRDRYICRPVDWVQVKGKKTATRIFEPLGPVMGPQSEAHRELARAFSSALDHYQKGEFEIALEKFVSMEKDELAQVFADRCIELLKDRPREWAGVFEAKSK